MHLTMSSSIYLKSRGEITFGNGNAFLVVHASNRHHFYTGSCLPSECKAGQLWFQSVLSPAREQQRRPDSRVLAVGLFRSKERDGRNPFRYELFLTVG